MFCLDLPVLRPDLATEGALWFNNLLLPDTTFILPVTLAVSSLLITEVSIYSLNVTNT